jgi:hypothetical protein
MRVSVAAKSKKEAMLTVLTSRNAIAGRLASALAIAALGLLPLASQAHAERTEIYCEGFYNPTGWCATEGTGFYRNTAHYGGAGTLQLCEIVEDVTLHVDISTRCANNTASSGNDLTGHESHWMWAAIENNGEHAHTIWGLLFYH